MTRFIMVKKMITHNAPSVPTAFAPVAEALANADALVATAAAAALDFVPALQIRMQSSVSANH